MEWKEGEGKGGDVMGGNGVIKSGGWSIRLNRIGVESVG